MLRSMCLWAARKPIVRPTIGRTSPTLRNTTSKSCSSRWDRYLGMTAAMTQYLSPPTAILFIKEMFLILFLLTLADLFDLVAPHETITHIQHQGVSLVCILVILITILIIRR